MSTTITGKLNKAANQFQAGESTGFGIRLGVQVYNPKTKEKQWTNYSAVLFARNANLITYMQNVLVEGAVIEVNATSELIQEYEGKYSIELLDAKLGYAYSGQQQSPQYQQGQQQQAAPQQQQQPQGSGFHNPPQQQQQSQQGGYTQNNEPPF